MQVRWSKLFLKTAVWFCAEIALTFLGMDDLADYSEFVFQDRSQFPALELLISLNTLI